MTGTLVPGGPLGGTGTAVTSGDATAVVAGTDVDAAASVVGALLVTSEGAGEQAESP